MRASALRTAHARARLIHLGPPVGSFQGACGRIVRVLPACDGLSRLPGSVVAGFRSQRKPDPAEKARPGGHERRIGPGAAVRQTSRRDRQIARTVVGAAPRSQARAAPKGSKLTGARGRRD